MNSKAIILIGAIGTLAVILLRKVRAYADMAQQISFVPKVYDKPKISLSKLTVPICIDIICHSKYDPPTPSGSYGERSQSVGR